MLDHDRRDLRQLSDLMAHRFPDRHPLTLQEHMATAAPLRPMPHDVGARGLAVGQSDEVHSDYGISVRAGALAIACMMSRALMRLSPTEGASSSKS
jgi:hypothetical protein